MPDAETTNGDPVDLTPLTDLADGEAWAMVESSPDGMVLADDQGAIVLVNRQIEELFGFERAELLGRPVEELLPEGVRARHRAHRTRYRAEPTVRAMGTGIELRARRADGSEFPVEVSLSPVHTANGARVVATVRDITERLAAEANSRTVLRALDTASDAVFVFSTHDLAFVYVNDGAVTQLGYSRDELLTMTPLHIKPDFSNESFREMIGPVAAGEVSGHVFTTLHRRADGEDVPVEIDLELAPTIGPEGPTMLLAIARDISDRLERQQAETNRAQSEALLADRERLAADLHDVVIQRLFGAGMRLQSIQSLVADLSAADRIRETVDELDTAIADLRASIFRLSREPGSELSDKIEALVRDAAGRLGFEPQLRVEGDLALVPPEVAEQLLPTLTESLSNIVRHAEASDVIVQLAITPDQLSLTVTDDGRGFDPDAARGNGLSNIEIRAKRMGGEASISRRADGPGTIVSWTARFD